MSGRVLSGLGVFVLAPVIVVACGSFGTDDTATTTDASTPPVSTADAASKDDAKGAPPTPQDGGGDADADPCSTCSATAVCEDRACVEVAKDLDKLRVQTACKTNVTIDLCTNSDPAPVTANAVIGGTTGHPYSVEIRVRGVVERREYLSAATSAGATGTSNAEAFVHLSSVPVGAWNTVGLDVDTTHYGLNSGNQMFATVLLDYVAKIPVLGGSKVQLYMTWDDTQMVQNKDSSNNPIKVPDIPPYPDVFKGQFVQVDVLSVTP